MPAPDRVLAGMLIRAVFLHESEARSLVHRMKYGGLDRVPALIATAMVERVPAAAPALVPVPRSVARTLRYGTDPAAALAAAMAARGGPPVIHALARPLWMARQARRPGATRIDPIFRAIRPVPRGAIVVDDVVTTGRTVQAARRALDGSVGLAVTVTTSGWCE